MADAERRIQQMLLAACAELAPAHPAADAPLDLERSVGASAVYSTRGRPFRRAAKKYRLRTVRVPRAARRRRPRDPQAPTGPQMRAPLSLPAGDTVRRLNSVLPPASPVCAAPVPPSQADLRRARARNERRRQAARDKLEREFAGLEASVARERARPAPWQSAQLHPTSYTRLTKVVPAAQRKRYA